MPWLPRINFLLQLLSKHIHVEISEWQYVPVDRRKRNRDTATQSYYKRKQQISELTDQVSYCMRGLMLLFYKTSLLHSFPQALHAFLMDSDLQALRLRRTFPLRVLQNIHM